MQFDYFEQLPSDMEVIQKDTMAFISIYKKGNARNPKNIKMHHTQLIIIAVMLFFSGSQSAISSVLM